MQKVTTEDLRKFGMIPEFLGRLPIVFSLDAVTKDMLVRILNEPQNAILRQYEALLAEAGSDEALAQALIAGDPEIDLVQTGRFIAGSQRILVNPDKQPIYKVRVVERVHNADGSVKEEKDFAARSQNIVGDFPVAWTGKKMPIAQAYNRFIFGRKYQLSHTSGLTYDFLYAMAKELHDSQSLMLMAAGAKGNEPLIFQENGKPYRAFLEGRIDGDKYLLLMHLSNLELKSIL